VIAAVSAIQGWQQPWKHSAAAAKRICSFAAEQPTLQQKPTTALHPPCMQAYVAPFLDLRYVTSYANDGTSISCHTFQRRFSRRYLQYRDPSASPPLQPGMLMGSGASAANVGADHSSATTAAAEAAVAASVAAAVAPAAPAAEPAADTQPQEQQAGDADAAACGNTDGGDIMLLEDGALADSERSLGRTLGPLDPALKMAARKVAHGLVQYVQKSHLLTLRGLVCEFVRDAEGHLWFLGPLRTEWASLIPGGCADGSTARIACLGGLPGVQVGLAIGKMKVQGLEGRSEQEQEQGQEQNSRQRNARIACSLAALQPCLLLSRTQTFQQFAEGLHSSLCWVLLLLCRAGR